MHKPSHIRNAAIIAHVDHGKTTLLDALLKQSNIFRDNQETSERMMDSYDQEKERGITIFSKHTSIYYNDYKLNLIDTPGHADFSGEVERVLGMVNTVLLIVDAQEGPMPQTRYVLSKSLKMGLKPIVVINKIDRPHADPDRVLNETFDLFVELGANDEQLDFDHCLASGLTGFAILNANDEKKDFVPLINMIIEKTSPPPGSVENSFLMQVATISYDDFLGRQGCGRILEGTIKKGDAVIHINMEGKQIRQTITKVEGHLGLERVEMEEAGAGDIVCLSGIESIMIGDSLSDPKDIKSLPTIEIDEPTVSVDITVNNGPFVGKSGKHVTMNKIRARLEREKKANVSYQIETPDNNQEMITVKGRGELHLAVLLEAMRRENFEFCVAKPRVIFKENEGKKEEPIQRVHVEVPEEYSGGVIDQLSQRKGEMQNLFVTDQGITHLEFLVPTRGLMGYRNDFLTTTRGLGVLTSLFDSYQDFKGEIQTRKRGALISISSGKATGYSCFNLEDRGDLFVEPGDEVYEGMIVGEHARENDLIVNIVKGKQLTNVRASGTDEQIILTPPRAFNLEQSITYINDDELIEATPGKLRFRKKFLTENERKRSGKK